MNRNQTIEWAKKIDKRYADLETKYGAFKINGNWKVNLWQPLAKNVNIIIFDKKNSEKMIKKVPGKFKSPNWSWLFKENLDGHFYQYEITQEDGNVNLALDPFAKSMASFNWEGKETKIGKAAFVNFKEYKNFRNLQKIDNPQPIIYEAHVRDLTSLRKDVSIPGSFEALKEARIAEHIKDLGFTTIQFLPIHNCYALNENDKKILGKGKGSKWKTNYNWGYDPHNYFSINGWYSSNPKNPYSRMKEFRDVVKYFHKNGINVIVDVVYNHLMTNNIFNNIMPNYYFRGGDDKEKIVTPVSYPPLASDRLMCRKIIINSLEWFVKAYDVDGFRFDLSCFTDKKTIKEIAKILRKIKPNIILHGEAWPWSDLNHKESFIKGVTDNNIDFGYFNDTTRNSIRGEDDGNEFKAGIIGGNVDSEFSKYLTSIIGNVKNTTIMPKEMSNSKYDLFTNTANNNVQYISCHDGHTMWDKINLTTTGTKEKKFESVRQAIIMQIATQGRLMFLAGTEMLYSKPNDSSGEEGHRYHKSPNAIDLFGLGKSYNENTYKTTDWSCGIRWEQLQGEVKTKIYNFMKKALRFRQSTSFFNIESKIKINKCIKFNYISKTKGIIDFMINIHNKSIRVLHNFKDNLYEYDDSGKLILDSKIQKGKLGKLLPHSSQIILKE